MSPGTVAVLADDLSGAADCASTFRGAGLAATVVLDRDLDLPADVGVLAISSETRDQAESEAPGNVRDAVEFLRGHSPRHWYQKVDSALRGHLAAELAALLEALDRPVALCATAFPANGRTVSGGRGYVGDTALEDSELWQAQGIEGPAELPEMLRRGGVEPELCELSELRAGGLRGRIEAAARPPRALVCDAETDADLAAVAEAGLVSGVPLLWVGSAGLAAALAERLAGEGGAGSAESVVEPDGPVLAAVGSASAVARAQFDELAAEVESLELPVEEVLAGGAGPETRLREALAGGGDLVLAPEPLRAGSSPSGPLAVQLAGAMGALVATQAELIGAYVLTGGATARAVLEACGVRALRLVDEVEVGVPLSLSLPGEKPVVTKAGSFGRPGTLVAARRRLRGGARARAVAGRRA